MKSVLLIACFGIVAFIGSAAAPTPQLNGFYSATSYNLKGLTASGDHTHRHIVAADPDLLPIGSRIKIKHAGRYSGEYFVADTGEKIVGRRLDLYIPSMRDCRKFGRKRVRVQVLSLGDNTPQAAKQASVEVKQDVKQDLARKVVGNAATEDDWATKKAAEANGASPAAANEKAASVAASKATPAPPPQ